MSWRWAASEFALLARVRPHPVTLQFCPHGTAPPCCGRAIALTVAPKINGWTQCRTAMSFLIRLPWLKYFGCWMTRDSDLYCALALPMRTAEPAIIWYMDRSQLCVTQWPAVNALVAVSMEPPQKWPVGPSSTNLKLTWCGCNSIVVLVPPIILSSSVASCCSKLNSASTPLLNNGPAIWSENYWVNEFDEKNGKN